MVNALNLTLEFVEKFRQIHEKSNAEISSFLDSFHGEMGFIRRGNCLYRNNELVAQMEIILDDILEPKYPMEWTVYHLGGVLVWKKGNSLELFARCVAVRMLKEEFEIHEHGIKEVKK